MIIDFLKEKKHFGIDISVSDETGMVLETGGGLQKASWFFEDGAPFLVHNVDILTDLNYHDLMAFHHQNKAIATLATRNRTTSRYLLFNNKNVLSGWKNIKTEEFELTLKPATENTVFVANNDLKYNLDSNILVVEANNYPLSIAGIIPNKDVSYTLETKSLLIEASIFNSKQIRQISRTIGVRTDRSSMYEKGLNSTYLIESLCRFLYLLKSLNNKISINIHTVGTFIELKPTIICLQYKTIIQILGPIINNKTNKFDKLSPLDVSNYLTRLNFGFSYDQSNLVWRVTISLQRYDDIKREIDLIEEIARLHGFNNFATILPALFQIGKEDFSYQIRKKITSCLLSEGFNEVINYSLVNLYNIQFLNFSESIWFII